jgi:hypothetical protein
MLPIIGGMATMPSRENSLIEALPSILKNVDILYLYLDKYKYVPKFLYEFKKIKIIENLNIGCSGKFLGLQMHHKSCIFFGFDDDIIYPNNYVEHLINALSKENFKAIVGVHGLNIKKPFNSYVKDIFCYHFEEKLDESKYSDILGGGTIAFHSNFYTPNINSWSMTNMDDLQIMRECIEQNLKRVCISRPKNFLKAIAKKQPDSIWQKNILNDFRETKFIQQTLKNFPQSFIQYASKYI